MAQNIALALACTLIGVAPCHAQAETGPVLLGTSADETGAAWHDFVQSLNNVREQAKSRATAPDATFLATLDRTMLMLIAQGALVIAQQDLRHPHFIPYINNSIPLLAPNPDTAYTVARIDGTGSYRISGNRGTVRLVDLQFAQGLWGLVDAPSPTLSNLDLDSLDIGSDGQFEFLLSQARPEDYEGNWVELDPRTDHIFVRQVAYDWLEERDADLRIRRLDVPEARQRPAPADIRAELETLTAYMRRLVNFSQGNFAREADRVNAIRFLGGSATSDALNLNQAYFTTRYEVGPDEALIMETDVPRDCRYWGVQLSDEWGNSLDYMYRQSSLNGGTASLDPDGKLRIVFSARDPGVRNWMDVSGYPVGSILGRWYLCDEAPLPLLRRIAFDDLDANLPAGTARVSEAERRALLARRVEGAQSRRLW